MSHTLPELPERCVLTLHHRFGPRDPSQADDLFLSGRQLSLVGDSPPPLPPTDFDHAFGPHITPEAASQEAMQQMLSSVRQGVNTLLLAFGHSAAGKRELLHAQPGVEGSSGLAERCIRALFQTSPPGVKFGLRFLSIAEERVADLLRADCHMQSVQLEHTASCGVEAVGVPFRPLLSESGGVGLYRQGREELKRLVRYHGVDGGSAANVLTISLSVPLRQTREAEADAIAPTYSSTLTMVELPGVEGLVEGEEERARLLLTQGASASRGIIHFFEVAEALAGRYGPQHVSRFSQGTSGRSYETADLRSQLPLVITSEGTPPSCE